MHVHGDHNAELRHQPLTEGKVSYSLRDSGKKVPTELAFTNTKGFHSQSDGFSPSKMATRCQYGGQPGSAFAEAPVFMDSIQN